MRNSRIYVAVGTLALVAYLFLPPQGQRWLYPLFPIATAVACLVRGRRSEPSSRPFWRLLALGVGLLALGDTLYELSGFPTFPGPADIAYGCSYLVILGAVFSSKVRSHAGTKGDLLDAAIVATSTGLLIWVAWLEPRASAAGALVGPQLLALAYIVFDLVFLTLFASNRSGVRSDPFTALVIGGALLLSGDTIYAVAALERSYAAGSWLDAMWLGSYTLWGAAAIMAPRVVRSEPVVTSRDRRLLALASSLALVAPPVALLYQTHFRPHVEVYAIAFAGALLSSLVVLRFAGARKQAVSALEEQTRLKAGLSDLLERESELSTQLRLLLDSTGEGIYGVDLQGRCTFFNHAAVRMLGLRPEEVLGRVMHEISHHTHEDGSPYPLEDCAIYRAMRTGESVTVVDEVFWRADGVMFPIEYSASPVFKDGVSTGAVVVFKDITERLRMEQELAESEELFRSAFMGGKAGMAVISLDDRYLSVNDSLCEMVGYSREELLQMDWIALTHPDDREANVELVNKLVTEQIGPYHLVKRYVHKDGRTIWVEMSDSVVKDRNGTPLHVVTQVQDVTQRIEAQLALEESRELLRSVIANSPDVIYIKRRDGSHVMVSQTFLDVFELSSNEVIGRTDLDLFSEEDAARFMAGDRQVFESQRPLDREETATHPDGSVHTYRSIRFPLFDSTGECYALCGMSSDITERKRSLVESEQLQAQLRQAQKMEAVGQLAGGVAHDFNNLLSVIINYSSFALETLAPDHEAQADLEAVVEAGKKGAALTRQLLTFARKEVTAPKLCSINEVISGMERLLRRSVPESISLEMDLRDSESLVWVDPGQLEQVLMNLSVNARDAMPAGGTLRIESGQMTLDVAGPGLDPGRYMRISVTDNGKGIAEPELEHIFEPFFTTKPVGAGTGLGLATVHGIVTKAGGRITVDSVLGCGTTFFIYLPVVEGQNAEVPLEPASTRLPVGYGERILVVEDEPAVRELVDRILSRAGYEVLVAGSAEEALRIATGESGHIALLLTDIVMPKMSGKALADVLDLPTIFMSGYTQQLIAEHGVLQHDEVLLQKPFSAEELLGLVRSELDRLAA